MSEVIYQKLAKSGFGLIYQSILYSGEDHLLLRKASTFTNGYNRYFFQDIQAIYLRRKGGFGAMLFAWGLLLSISVILALWAPDMRWAAFPIILAVLFFFFFLKTVLGGPFCEVTLETAAQSVRLSALGTERKALEVMETLKQKIENVQGVVSAEDLLAEDAPAARRQKEESTHLAKVTPWHWGTYLAWLFSAVLLGMIYMRNGPQWVGVLTFVLVMVTLVTGLVGVSHNLRRRRENTPLEWLTYASLGFLFLRAGLYYFFIILFGLDQGEITSTAIMNGLSSGAIFNSSEFRLWFGIEAIIATFFGLFGLLFCAFGSKSQQEP